MESFSTRDQVKFTADVKVESVELGVLAAALDLAPTDGLVDYVFVYEDPQVLSYPQKLLSNASVKWDGARLIIKHSNATIDVASFSHNDTQGLNLEDSRVFFEEDGISLSLSDYQLTPVEERSMLTIAFHPTAATCGQGGISEPDCDGGGIGSSSCLAEGCTGPPTGCGTSCNVGYYACCGCVAPPPCTAILGCYFEPATRSHCHCCAI